MFAVDYTNRFRKSAQPKDAYWLILTAGCHLKFG